MATAQGIKAGQAFVEISALDKTQAVLKGIRSNLNKFGAEVRNIGLGLVSLGGSLLAPLAGVRHFDQFGDQLDKMSERTGMSVRMLRELQVAADLGGTSLEEAEPGIKKLQVSLFALRSGGAQAAFVFQRLGLTWDNLKDLSPDDQFRLVAERLSQVDNATMRAALAQKILGRSGTMLLPMITSMEQARRAIAAFGLEVTEADTKSAAKLNDTLALMKTAVMMVAFKVGAALAPTIVKLAEIITPIIGGIATFIEENQGLVTALTAVALTVMVAGGVFLGVAVAIKVATFALSAMATVLPIIASLFSFLFNPITLLVIGFELLIATLIATSSVGRMVLSQLWATFQQTLGGMFDALMQGNLALAGQILWAGLKLAFAQGMSAIMNVWDTGIAQLKIAWIGLKSFLSDVWIILWGQIVNFALASVKAILTMIFQMRMMFTPMSKAAKDAATKTFMTGLKTTLPQRDVDKELEENDKLRQAQIADVRDQLAKAKKDRADNVAELQAELDRLTALARKPKEMPAGPEAVPTQDAIRTPTTPAALEGLDLGSVAAAKAASENQQSQFLSTLVDLSEESLEELQDLNGAFASAFELEAI